ncbi:MAG TPA: hypothetical protein VLF88_01800 [Candidatus Babeliales bacterium]|nr:hypothetical protein [Candidatus Babeliales bacterium]
MLLDVLGEVQDSSDIYDLVDEALQAARLERMVVFDLTYNGKTAHVRVKADSRRDWLIEGIQHILSREDYEDGSIGPYPHSGVLSLGAIAARAFTERPGGANVESG